MVLFLRIVITALLCVCMMFASALSKEVTSLRDWKKTEPSYFDASLLAFTKTCHRKRWKTQISALNVSPVKWHKLCKKAKAYKGSAKSFFETYFHALKVELSTEKNAKKGLFTGYYAIALDGSLTKTERFKYPIYAPPSNYEDYTRQQINNGALHQKNLEIAWVDDPVRLFFLHVQGSGILQLPDGSKKLISFAKKNNKPYSSIGKELIDLGYLKREEVTAESIQAWLYLHPQKMDRIFNVNESYVFFSLKDNRAPIGAAGVGLTSEASLAVDNRFIPYGMPLWVNTTLTATTEPFNRLMIAQDTGSAIRGRVRGDIYFGTGAAAEHYASVQNDSGTYYALIPNE